MFARGPDVYRLANAGLIVNSQPPRYGNPREAALIALRDAAYNHWLRRIIPRWLNVRNLAPAFTKPKFGFRPYCVEKL